MRALIANNNWIYFDNITVPEEEALWVAFSAANKNTYIDPTQMNMWDGVHRKYNRAKKRIARPLLSMLNTICIERNLPLELKDLREPWNYKTECPFNIDADFLPGIKLEHYQIGALQKACKTECGIISLPTGAGKGEVICGLCKAIDCPTAIIATQRVVIDQIKERLQLRDLTDVGMFYAGIKPSGEKIVVGSIQSLAPPTKVPEAPHKEKDEDESHYRKRVKRWEKSLDAYKTRKINSRALQQYIKNAEMLIVDEVDLATSKQFKYLFRHLFSGRRRYGLSGTPFKDDPVHKLILQEHMGSIIYEETLNTVQALGRIIPCEYYMMAFGMNGDKRDGTAYDIAFDEMIVKNELFHKLCTAICKQYKGDGTLILVDKSELGNSLVDAIRSAGLTARFIYGKTTKKVRKETLQMFERRELDVLVGGKIINRGLDLKSGCENLILATGGKSVSELKQKIGRALRLNSRGKSRVFDFLFLNNKYLYGHSRTRLKAVIELGYETHVVFPYCKISGQEFVDSRFRVPKKPNQPLFKDE